MSSTNFSWVLFCRCALTLVFLTYIEKVNSNTYTKSKYFRKQKSYVKKKKETKRF